MRRKLGVAVLVFGLLTLGCDSGGGGGTLGPGNTGGNSFTARIDGQAWASLTTSIFISGNPGDPVASPLTITGINASGIGVQLYLAFIAGPGTYPLGVNIFTNAGGTAQVVVPPSGWLTPLSGAAGSVTITARTATRIAGSFTFTADALAGATPPQRTVTEGDFDISVGTGLPALPTGTASTCSATLDSAPWNAATVVAVAPGGDDFSLTASNTEYQLTAVPQVTVAPGNVYAVPSEVSITVVGIGSGAAWTAAGGPDVGTWTLESYSATGMSGSFSATLPRQGGGTALTLSDGTFEVEFQ